MRNIFFLILILAGVHSTDAQGPNWQLQGIILDEPGDALPGATLQIADQQTVSDGAGQFNFMLQEKSGWLTVRCIGYFPQRISLDTLQFQGKTARLTIILKSNEISLPEIAITSKPIEAVFEEDFQSDLLDYAFAGENLMLLVKLKKNYFLRLTDDKGRQLAQLRLPEPAALLHRSCTGDLHVVGEHNAWEITLVLDRIDTFPRYSTALFSQLVKPCVLEQNGYYFYEKMGAYRQSVQYIYYDPDRRQHLLAVIRNEVAEAQLLRRHREILAAYMRTIPDVDRDDILNGYSPLSDPRQILKPENLTRMAETNGLITAIGFFSTLAEDSVYAPLIGVGEVIYLIDHVNDKLIRFSLPPGQDQTLNLDYHHGKGWRKEVLTDAALNRVYGRFTGFGGTLILKELNLRSGSAGKIYRLRLAPYLSDTFKIRNGVLYFIGQPDINLPNRRLYKMNIFTFAE